jgi:hypothetical protein
MYDNQEHYHSSDRFPSRDTLQWLNSLENVKNVSTNYTVETSDDYLLVDTTAGDVTVTLPTARNGRKLVIANYAGTNDVIVTSTVDINGSASDFTITTGNVVSVKDIVGEWLTSPMTFSSGGGGADPGASGSTTIDFGASPATEASVTVSGQTGLLSTSQIEAFVVARGSGATLANQQFAAIAFRLICGEITPGASFVIRAYCTIGYAEGTFEIDWTWRN